MKKILVAYATMAGSTAEVAQKVGDVLTSRGLQAEVLPISAVNSLEAYDGIVVGGPMIMGWHREALRFLKQNRAALQRVPLAVFIIAMSLTQTGETSVEGIPVFVDEKLPKPPKAAGSLSFRERYARLENYVRPILAALTPGKPASLGVFGGRMEYGRLKWWAVLFAMLIIQAPAGDRRNWEAIQAWAGGLPEQFQLETETPEREFQPA